MAVLEILVFCLPNHNLPLGTWGFKARASYCSAHPYTFCQSFSNLSGIESRTALLYGHLLVTGGLNGPETGAGLSTGRAPGMS